MHNRGMNKRPTKAEIRRELEQQVADFVRSGGKIEGVRSGLSGLRDGEVLQPPFNDGKPSQSRTPVMDVLASIDARRRQPKTSLKKSPSRKPRKKTIYDDFGEPIRVVWED